MKCTDDREASDQQTWMVQPPCCACKPGLREVHACRFAEWKAAKNLPDCLRRASLSVADSLPQKASPAARMVCVHSSTCSQMGVQPYR